MNNLQQSLQPMDIKVNQIVNKLVKFNVLHSDTVFNSEKFHAFKKDLIGNLTLPSTTISPIMERILFSISSSKCIQNIVILGSYYGYALIWLAGGMNKSANFRVVGFDINEEACEGAKKNLNNINLEWVEINNENAFSGIERFEDSSIDLILLDVEKDGSKSDYVPLLDTWHRKLKAGALVLAHDPVVEKFSDDFKEYFKCIEDKNRFSFSITLPIDECGLCISKTNPF